MSKAKRQTNKANKNKWRWITAIGFLLVILLFANGIANSNIGVTRYIATTKKTDASLRIAQISDFHNDKKLGEKLIAATEAQNPDIIVITGDFIDSNRTDMPYALSIAKKLAEIAPTYYITGNHEASLTSCAKFKEQLRDLGIFVLEGSGVEIQDNIMLFGIDDPSTDWDQDADSTGNIDFIIRSLNINEDKYNILLSHRPEAFAAYSNFDLVFSGHAHGGQIRIPFIGGVVAPDQGLFPRYDAGEYQSESTTMIVSRGIGNSIIPIRINNPPEIVIVDIN